MLPRPWNLTVELAPCLHLQQTHVISLHWGVRIGGLSTTHNCLEVEGRLAVRKRWSPGEGVVQTSSTVYRSRAGKTWSLNPHAESFWTSNFDASLLTLDEVSPTGDNNRKAKCNVYLLTMVRLVQENAREGNWRTCDPSLHTAHSMQHTRSVESVDISSIRLPRITVDTIPSI